MRTHTTHSRYQTARGFLLFWCLFIGVGAVAGAVGMLVAPDGSALGMQTMLPCFQVLPFADVLFQDFVFPGIALLCVNGLPNLLAAALMLGKKRAGVTLGGILGITLMLWICIQFFIFEFNFMSTSYFVFGALQAATGYAAHVFDKQERFVCDLSSYPNIGSDPKLLVVFFSRMGYARKLAYEEANATGACVYEIKATERTDGTAGFWWCGRYGMHGWDMPIAPCPLALSSYEKVTVVSPVWVFGLAAPVKSFCKAARGNIKRADIVLVHHMNRKYATVADNFDALLGVRRERFRSVRCHAGRFNEQSHRRVQGG